MSDTMLHGVLNMPLPDDPRELDAMTWLQFRDRASDASAQIASLTAERDRAVAMLAAIDELITFEINPSNYDHDQVCEMNSLMMQIGGIALGHGLDGRCGHPISTAGGSTAWSPEDSAAWEAAWDEAVMAESEPTGIATPETSKYE